MRFLYLILALLSIVAFVRGGKPPQKNVCELPMMEGKGQGSFQRFYYDKDVQSCTPFYYRGKKGNKNNFETLKACNKKCVCGLPKETGNGFALIDSWYFDQKKNKCKMFKFGGGNGNANNFMSEDECLKTCGDTPDGNTGVEEASPYGKTSSGEEDVCTLPMNVGKGKARHQRWYYNGMTCKKFNFKGSRGNANNFMSKKECLNACEKDVCQQPMDEGPGKAIFERYYYNQEEKKCKTFSYGGQGGNGNNFKSKKECRKACLKEEPKVTEPEVTEPEVTEPEEKKPKGKKPKGKKPKGNKPSTGEENVCTLPMNEGKGKARHQRWYYNGKTCEKFNFKGKKGNANNFMSKKECLNACVNGNSNEETPSTGEENVCKLPKEEGKGKGNHRRWYYNGQVCKKFNFKGRKGNANNFKSEKECRKECVNGNSNEETPSTGEENVCKLPKEIGDGKAIEKRFYFDQKKQKCQKFNYGGQGGNRNNFENVKACNMECVCSQPKQEGKGRAKHRRWYYDGTKCKKFNFKGGKRNANHFKNKKACNKACLPKKDV